MRPYAVFFCVSTRGSRAVGLRGFTLIELIMVVVLVGVLAVFAVPRMINTGDFFPRGFQDQTMAVLRFAQKTAIAQRRTVCVTFTANTITLNIAALPAGACNTPLNGPQGAPVLTAPNGTTFAAVPAPLFFNGLGQPVDNAGATVGTQTLQVGVLNITVEAGTGYVH